MCIDSILDCHYDLLVEKNIKQNKEAIRRIKAERTYGNSVIWFVCKRAKKVRNFPQFIEVELTLHA
jgi:hypothetical protein